MLYHHSLKKVYTILIIFICTFTVRSNAQIKEDNYSNIIQFSGIVVAGDSAYGVPGVFLYLPKTGQGTMSNEIGFFSFAIGKGDTLEIRALGFKRRTFAIPTDIEDDLSVVIELVEDSLTLPSITITAFPSEREFKNAFLAQEIPEQELSNMYTNLNDQVMSRLLVDLELDGSETSTYYMQQQVNFIENRNTSPVITLLDPFAWKRFIQDLKDHKEKKEKEKQENTRY